MPACRAPSSARATQVITSTQLTPPLSGILTPAVQAAERHARQPVASQCRAPVHGHHQQHRSDRRGQPGPPLGTGHLPGISGPACRRPGTSSKRYDDSCQQCSSEHWGLQGRERRWPACHEWRAGCCCCSSCAAAWGSAGGAMRFLRSAAGRNQLCRQQRGVVVFIFAQKTDSFRLRALVLAGIHS